MTELGKQEGLSQFYVTRLLRLTTLSPKIQEAILTGKQPPDLTANRLMRLPSLPTDWAEQEALLSL